MYENSLTGCQLGKHQNIYGICSGPLGNYAYKNSKITTLRRCAYHARHLVVGWYQVVDKAKSD